MVLDTSRTRSPASKPVSLTAGFKCTAFTLLADGAAAYSPAATADYGSSTPLPAGESTDWNPLRVATARCWAGFIGRPRRWPESREARSIAVAAAQPHRGRLHRRPAAR